MKSRVKTIILLSLSLICFATEKLEAAERVVLVSRDEVYKESAQRDLTITIYSDSKSSRGRAKAAIVFFHGGGWGGGSPSAFEYQSRYFAEQGLVCFSVAYRLTKVDGTTPYESLQDAKSAMRYIRANAERFNIDPEKIVTSGGSAGGHLAAAVALCPKINDPEDDMSISTNSAALILFNPVVNNGAGTVGKDKGYGYSKVKSYWGEFSPMHNIREGVPPTLFMLGDRDNLIPTEVAYEFERRVEECGGLCRVCIYEDRGHGFFNLRDGDARNFIETVTEAHLFIRELGFLKNRADVEEFVERVLPDYRY